MPVTLTSLTGRAPRQGETTAGSDGVGWSHGRYRGSPPPSASPASATAASTRAYPPKARRTPRLLPARDWRVCLIEGPLQATTVTGIAVPVQHALDDDGPVGPHWRASLDPIVSTTGPLPAPNVAKASPGRCSVAMDSHRGEQRPQPAVGRDRRSGLASHAVLEEGGAQPPCRRGSGVEAQGGC